MCSACYQFNMRHEGRGMCCCGVEGVELDEEEADDSVVHWTEPDYEKDGTHDDDKIDAAVYTNRKGPPLKIIAEANVGAASDDDDDNDNDNNVIGVDVDDDDDDNDNDNNNNNDNVEKQEKDEAFFTKEKNEL